VSDRRDAKKEKIELWRSQMKKLEDKPGYRKMYDRLGKDQLTLLETRDRARNETLLRNKR
jgi:hypothetical protein